MNILCVSGEEEEEDEYEEETESEEEEGEKSEEEEGEKLHNNFFNFLLVKMLSFHSANSRTVR